MIHERNNFKMGTVEMLVLSLLSQKDLYGYEISLLLKDLSEGSYVVPEGSLYPVLYKLEDKKLITSHAIQTGNVVYVNIIILKLPGWRDLTNFCLITA